MKNVLLNLTEVRWERVGEGNNKNKNNNKMKKKDEIIK